MRVGSHPARPNRYLPEVRIGIAVLVLVLLACIAAMTVQTFGVINGNRPAEIPAAASRQG